MNVSRTFFPEETGGVHIPTESKTSHQRRRLQHRVEVKAGRTPAMVKLATVTMRVRQEVRARPTLPRSSTRRSRRPSQRQDINRRPIPTVSAETTTTGEIPAT